MLNVLLQQHLEVALVAEELGVALEVAAIALEDVEPLEEEVERPPLADQSPQPLLQD
jgi:hypothetical protein